MPMRLIFAAFILCVAAAVSNCRHANPVVLDARLPAELKLKHLIVRLDAVGQQIHIFNESQNRTLLRLNLKEAFATVRRSEDNVVLKHGGFKMGEAEKERCDLLRLLRNYIEKSEMVLHGRLQCGQKVTDIDLRLRPETDRVVMTLRPHDSRFNRIKFRVMAEKDEHVFNPALKSESGDLNGKKISLVAQAVAGAQAPVPFFMTTAMRSFDTTQAAYQEWEFSRHELAVEIWDNFLELNIATADNFPRLLSDYSRRTASAVALPDWALGYVLIAAGGKEKTDAAINAAAQAGHPVSAVWLQDLFVSPQGLDAEVDEKNYPDFRNWVRVLNGQGARIFATINPFLSGGEKIFHDAKMKHFIVRNRKFEPYKVDLEKAFAYVIDLTNPQARLFVKERLKSTLNTLGIYGLVAGFGGSLPWDAELQSTEPASLWHNRYATEWERLGAEAILEAGLRGRAEFVSAARFSDLADFSALGLGHIALKPYSSVLQRENQLSGLPALRPVYLHYAMDPNTYTLSGQMMYGSDVILATGNQRVDKIYLPAGSWFEAPGGKTVPGGQWVSVAATAGKPTRFIRKGAEMEGLLISAFK